MPVELGLLAASVFLQAFDLLGAGRVVGAAVDRRQLTFQPNANRIAGWLREAAVARLRIVSETANAIAAGASARNDLVRSDDARNGPKITVSIMEKSINPAATMAGSSAAMVTKV